MHSNVSISLVLPAGLRIRSKKDAMTFYKGVKSCILIPFTDEADIRIEPGNHFSFLQKDNIRRGMAWAIPSYCDPEGQLAYMYRKYINAYLKED